MASDLRFQPIFCLSMKYPRELEINHILANNGFMEFNKKVVGSSFYEKELMVKITVAELTKLKLDQIVLG